MFWKPLGGQNTGLLQNANEVCNRLYINFERFLGGYQKKEAVAKLQFSTANIPGKCFGSL
jgi:hypothetical protein